MTTRTPAKARRATAPAVRTLLRPDEFAGPHREWLAEGVLVAGSPAVIAGGRIELTWFTTDLAVSLATGAPFLGRFPAARRRVAYYCYETAFADVATLARAVADARGVDLATSDLRLGRRGAALRTRAEWQAAVAEVRDEGVEVVVIDPIRVALRTGDAAGQTEPEVERVPAIGEAFLAAGVTPVFAHGTDLAGDTPRLANLGTAGLGDYVRQWLFVGRLGPVKQYGHGAFRLTAGGFAGHAGEWGVRAEVGRLGPDFGGLIWDVAVTDGADLPAEAPPTGHIGTTADIRTAYAAATEEAVVRRGKRLTATTAKGHARSAQSPTPDRPAGPNVFSFA